MSVTAPGAAADSDSVSPAEFDAVVPDRFVRLRVGFPWLWFDAAYEVSTDAVTRDDPDIPNVTPLELENTTVPVETDCVPAEIPTPPPAPGLAALRLRVSPALLEAVVPERLVSASVGLPCE